MPRFVILEHDHPEVHWDFMLETGNVLRTWRLTQAPIYPFEEIAAMLIGDHRLLYLDYEGPVSGRRGRVVRWDEGRYEEVSAENVRSANLVVVRLEGSQLQGKASLEHLAGDQWSFRFTPDS